MAAREWIEVDEDEDLDELEYSSPPEGLLTIGHEDRLRAMYPPKLPGAECWRCPLRDATLVPPDPARNPSGWAQVGESPGAEEQRHGIPFIGKSGQITDALLPMLGLDRSRVHTTNACMCYPGSGDEKADVLREATDCCRKRLLKELINHSVDNILTMGEWAVKSFMGPTRRMSKMFFIVGKRFETDLVTGEEWDPVNGGCCKATVYPIYHPAYVMRIPPMMIDVSRDLERFTQPVRKDMKDVHEIIIVDDDETLGKCIEDLARHRELILDLETDGFDPRHNRILCMVLCGSKERSYVITEECLYRRKDWIVGGILKQDHFFIGHNFKFDAQFCLTNLGYTPKFGFDTLLADYLLDERPFGHSLKDVVMREFELTYDYEEIIEKWLRSNGHNPKTCSYRVLPTELLYKYAGLDGYYTLEIYEILRARLEGEGRLMETMTNVMVPGQNAWVHVELNGMYVDQEYLAELNKKTVRQMAQAIVDCRRLTGNPNFNPASAPQVEKYLFVEKELPRPIIKGDAKAKKTKSKTGKQVLDAMGDNADPIIVPLKSFRKAAKLKGTYLEMPQDEDGRIRPDVSLAGTVTGRLSTKVLVNIPRGDAVRGMFTASPGYTLISADYKQAELYMMANESLDPFICQIFLDGRDIHNEIAAALHGPNYTKEDRMGAKNFNFGIVYSGLDYQAIAYNLGMTVARVKELGKRYMDHAPLVQTWIDNIKDFVAKNGYVESRMGRRRRFPVILDWNRRTINNEAMNFNCQATASDMTLLSLVDLVEYPRYGIRVLNMVHDSVIAEAPTDQVMDAARHIHDVMVEMPNRWLNPKVPFKVDISVGSHWNKLEDVEFA